MEAIFNFIPAPIALVLMFIGFAALAVGAIRLGYKQYVKQWALELVTIAEDSIMGSGQGAKKKAQVFAALRGALGFLFRGEKPLQKPQTIWLRKSFLASSQK